MFRADHLQAAIQADLFGFSYWRPSIPGSLPIVQSTQGLLLVSRVTLACIS